MTEKITKDLLEKSLREHNDFIKMVCLNKYGHDNREDVIKGVINYCNITDDKQKELMYDCYFTPAGSILSKCNTDTKGSFSNCYFTPIENDSIESIFECHKKLARTFSFRGGSGVSLTVLRPYNEPVNNAAKKSSGAVSFMPLFSNTTKTISQLGRRGALILLLDIRHPDALKFIWSKAKPEEVFEVDTFTGNYPTIDGANISLQIPDSFMEAVKKDEDFTFYFPDIEADKEKYNREWDGDYDKWEKSGGKFKYYNTIKAREVFKQIAEAAWMCGDPGIWFVDTAQRDTFGTYINDKLKPTGVNPCGEQGLSPYNNCLLGTFVLTKYIEDSVFNWSKYSSDIRTATKLMNCFSDINQDKHPLQEQINNDIFGKRIGIEITAFGDACAFLGYRYGDDLSKTFANELTKKLLYESMDESCEIAKEKGPCKALVSIEDRERFIDSCNYCHEVIDKLSFKILKYGMANTSFNTVGPCGSISIISGNTTSGIEPVFKFSYKRKNRIDNKEYSFIHLPAVEYMYNNLEEFEGLTLTEAKKKLNYVEADELNWKERIDVQASFQKYIDSSISSTLNLSSTCKVEEIIDIYLYAWEKELKGVTVFRDGCKQGVLSGTETKEPYKEQEIYEKELLDEEIAVRHRVMWKRSKLYVNVSTDEDNNPIEIFTKLPKESGIDGDGRFSLPLFNERNSNWDLISRLISLCLRYGISLEHIIEQLEKSSYSIVDAASILKRILSKYKKCEDNEMMQECPECGSVSYILEGGCGKCNECGFSACG